MVGPEFLMDEDIVLVKVNYRLGVFGFLTFESPDLPGNQGMKDQVMALKWVQENIASFGGNRNLVTIIGESAGGSSVYSHIVSPLSKGLFHHAISESGTIYSLWALTPPGYRRSVTELLLTYLGCSKNPAEAILCAKNKTSEEIFSKLNYVYIKTPQVGFGPVIEAPGLNSFLVGQPTERHHSHVPLIIGTDSAEGLSFSKSWLGKDFDFKTFSDDFNKNAPSLLGYALSSTHPDEITKELRKYYLPNEQITIRDFANLTMIVTDSTFSVSVMDGANKHKGNTYFYYCNYTVPIPNVDEKYLIGATHAAESRFIWNYTQTEFYPPIADPNFKTLSEKFIKMLVSFMSTGIPVIEASDFGWKTWTPENHNYVLIDSKGFYLKKGFSLDERYKFWKSINYRDKQKI